MLSACLLRPLLALSSTSLNSQQPASYHRKSPAELPAQPVEKLPDGSFSTEMASNTSGLFY